MNGLAVAGAGALAYLVVSGEHPADHAPVEQMPPSQPPLPQPLRPGQPGWKAQHMAAVGQVVTDGAIQGTANPKTPASANGPVKGQADLDAAKRAALTKIEAEAAKQYDNLTEVEKARAADALNHSDLKIDGKPVDFHLDGHETWKEAGQKIGGALGGAAGAAAVGWLPAIGPLIAPFGTTLGAMIGAYLGGAFAEWAQKQWKKLEDWIKGVGDDIEGYASDAYDAVGDAASDVADYLGF